jgi:hypothetical protein
MDVGSGYDPLLLAANKRDAHETIQYGILGEAFWGGACYAGMLVCICTRWCL